MDRLGKNPSDVTVPFLRLPSRSFIKTGLAAKLHPTEVSVRKVLLFKPDQGTYTYICWTISSEYPKDHVTSCLYRFIKGQSREIGLGSIIFYARAIPSHPCSCAHRAQTNSNDLTLSAEYFSNKKNALLAIGIRKCKITVCPSKQPLIFFRTHCPFLAELLIHISIVEDYSIQFSA